MKKTPVNNFLLLASGITLLFCATLPDLSSLLMSALRAALSFLGLGALSVLLIVSKVFFVLGGSALAALGLVGTITERQKAGLQPNWSVVGCVAGGATFALLSLIPVLFWIGIFAAPALVFALILAYRDAGTLFRNPLSVPAALLLLCLLIAFWDRFFNSSGVINAHVLGSLFGMAAFVGIVIFRNKLVSAFDANGRSALQLMMIGSILYAVAGFFNLLAILVFFIGWVGAVAALAGWVLFLIAAIKLMNASVLGRSTKQTGLFMMIGLLASIMAGLPLVGVAAIGLIGYGWMLLINTLEEA